MHHRVQEQTPSARLAARTTDVGTSCRSVFFDAPVPGRAVHIVGVVMALGLARLGVFVSDAAIFGAFGSVLSSAGVSTRVVLGAVVIVLADAVIVISGAVFPKIAATEFAAIVIVVVLALLGVGTSVAFLRRQVALAGVGTLDLPLPMNGADECVGLPVAVDVARLLHGASRRRDAPHVPAARIKAALD